MLDKNLKALGEGVLPKYIENIKKAKPEDWAEIIMSNDGRENLLIAEGSRKTAAYSMDDTQSRIKAQVKSLPTREQDISVLIGIGLGYLLDELLRKKDKLHRVMVVEPSLWILQQALKRFDFSEGLKGKTVFFASVPEDITIILASLDAAFTIESYTLSIEDYAVNKPRIYNKLIEHTANLINNMRCNTGTVASAGAILADNDIANLPYVIAHRGVKELKDLFKDKPAVMVSTGPSLRKNIHLLKDYQDKVIIVAVAQALRVLLAYDIRPDFITTVDFGEVNMVHLQGLMDSDIPLICLNKTYAPLLHSYQGPRFITASPNPGYEDKAHGILNGKGALDSGGSVAHLTFSAAVLMSCDPIILIGQDLALSGGESHNPQADATGRIEVDEGGMIRWKIRDQRCHLKDIDGGEFSMGMAHEVEGYFGELVLTNIGLASFITVFQNMFLSLPHKTIINATQGGARIRGSHQMPLEKALQEHAAAKALDKSAIDPLLSLADNADELIRQVIPLLEEDIKILRKIGHHSRMGLRINKKMLNVQPWYRTEKLIKANAKHSIKAHELAKQMPLVSLAIFGASRRIEYSDLKVEGEIGHMKKNREDFQIRVKRNRIILEAARDASRSLKETYIQTLNRLKKYKETENEDVLQPQLPDEIPSLDDAEEYFEQGNFARPLLTAQKMIKNMSPPFHGSGMARVTTIEIINKALTMRNKAIEEAEQIDEDDLIECNELVYDAQQIGREDIEYGKSLKMLIKAVELCPDNESALWGLATTYHHTDCLKDSIETYRKLIDQYPDRYRYRFEFGQVLVKTGEIEEGLDQIGKAMIETDEFNSFLWVVGDICREAKLWEKALLAYDTYLEHFPADYKAMRKKADVLEQLNKKDEAKELMKKADLISGG